MWEREGNEEVRTGQKNLKIKNHPFSLKIFYTLKRILCRLQNSLFSSFIPPYDDDDDEVYFLKHKRLGRKKRLLLKFRAKKGRRRKLFFSRKGSSSFWEMMVLVDAFS